jgi:hypothetical protein
MQVCSVITREFLRGRWVVVSYRRYGVRNVILGHVLPGRVALWHRCTVLHHGTGLIATWKFGTMDSLIYIRAFRLKAIMSAFWPADVVTIFVWFGYAVRAAG